MGSSRKPWRPQAPAPGFRTAPKTRPVPHLVCDQHDAVFVCQLPQRLHEAGRGRQEAALPQHRLKDDGGDVRRVHLGGVGAGAGKKAGKRTHGRAEGSGSKREAQHARCRCRPQAMPKQDLMGWQLLYVYKQSPGPSYLNHASTLLPAGACWPHLLHQHPLQCLQGCVAAPAVVHAVKGRDVGSQVVPAVTLQVIHTCTSSTAPYKLYLNILDCIMLASPV